MSVTATGAFADSKTAIAVFAYGDALAIKVKNGGA
jgi:hypothetical protein